MRWLWWLLVPAAAYLWLTIYHRIAHREEIAASNPGSAYGMFMRGEITRREWVESTFDTGGDIWDEIAAGPAD